MSAGSSVLYVVSRFPKVTETFVVNEWWALERRFRMEFASLLKTKEPPIHPKAAGLLPRVQFLPALARSSARANASLCFRSPRLYVRLVAEVVRGSVGRPAGGIAKGIVVFWKAVALAERVSALGVGHVHAHFSNHPATAAWLVHRITGVPFSFTAHANDLFVGPALLEEKVRSAEFVVAISEYNRAYLRKLIPDHDDVHVIHCGVNVDAFSFSDRRGSRRLICVARLEHTKGYGDLLEALASLAPDFGDLTLDVIGGGPERSRLVALTSRLALTERVRFQGPLPTDAVRDALAEADLFVLASVPDESGRMEGIPVALMEAMASGVPVVATALSGIPELVVDERTGLLVGAGRPDELASAIRRLVEDPELARALARGARDHVQRHFNLEREAGRLAELFESSLARSANRQD